MTVVDMCGGLDDDDSGSTGTHDQAMRETKYMPQCYFSPSSSSIAFTDASFSECIPSLYSYAFLAHLIFALQKFRATNLAFIHLRIIPTMSCILSVAFSCTQIKAPKRGRGIHGLLIPDPQIFNDIAAPTACPVRPYIYSLEMVPERSLSSLRVDSLGR